MSVAVEGLVERLRAQGMRYHNLHPFHVRMDRGELTRDELQRWVANRFYYQRCIPLKDAAILSNCPEVEVRRVWIERITDHDGTSPGTGGIESWLRLGEALGVARDELLSERRVLPAVRYAVDAYVNFARHRPWIEAVASSLTELFGPGAIRVRLAALEAHYPWIDPAGLEYFRARLGISSRTAHDMGHVPLSGAGGTLEALARLQRPRKALVHINNTNPILLEDSPERTAVVRAGVEVAYDGLEVEL